MVRHSTNNLRLSTIPKCDISMARFVGVIGGDSVLVI